jgi:hypothetical protein
MTPITLPQGLELPEGQTEISAVIDVVDGQAYLVALDGIALEEGEDMEEEDEGMEEGGEAAQEQQELDFLASIEQQLAGQPNR